jgi:hypothetical protein
VNSRSLGSAELRSDDHFIRENWSGQKSKQKTKKTAFLRDPRASVVKPPLLPSHSSASKSSS